MHVGHNPKDYEGLCLHSWVCLSWIVYCLIFFFDWLIGWLICHDEWLGMLTLNRFLTVSVAQIQTESINQSINQSINFELGLTVLQDYFTQNNKVYEAKAEDLPDKKTTFEPPHDKTDKMACAPSEDSDQPGHPPSPIRVFAVRMKKAWVLSYPLNASKVSYQTGRMPRLIWVFAGRTCHFVDFATRRLIWSSASRTWFFIWRFMRWWHFSWNYGTFHETIALFMTLWHFSSFVNSFFKRACAAVYWG